MPRVTGNRASRPPSDAHRASRRGIVKHCRRRRALPIRFPPTNRHSAPVPAIRFSALHAANSWTSNSRLRTDRPSVTCGSYRTILTARSRNRLEMDDTPEKLVMDHYEATEEKRRVANRRVNRGSEAHGRRAARQVTSRMRSMYSRCAAGAVTQVTSQRALVHQRLCATSHGDVRSISGKICLQTKKPRRKPRLLHRTSFSDADAPSSLLSSWLALSSPASWRLSLPPSLPASWPAASLVLSFWLALSSPPFWQPAFSQGPSWQRA
jgi:hypothetical protein